MICRFLVMSLILSVSVFAHAEPAMCELHPNSCPPNTFPIKDAPVGDCPVNSCSSSLPSASIVCDAGMCEAYPQPVNTSFEYQWSVSNPTVSISAFGAQLSYSCTQNTNVMIRVFISGPTSEERTAQQLVYCQRPLTGNNLQPQ